ncbi:ABC transporter ATP-binding protein [Pseudolysinimonas sp.]|jgi:ABC-2 type transport system ATP-binding protein|uniref:ABC transporter ATP-binding protein n=1 Tax=Pseudolysinimonas sp. TaxID=2680009 RepID=UPI0037838706
MTIAVDADRVVIDVADVTKRFVIRRDKSLKERLVNFGRSRRHRNEYLALRDVSLQIEGGSSVALIGANGSGKSTLLKIIGGILQPTSGQVRSRGRVAALLELGAGFHPDLTGRENVYLNAAILGLSRDETDRHFEDIVDFSGIREFIDTQVKFYSSGMYVRLAFAVAVHVDPDILIVDEVLAVGDEAFQHKCLDHIRRFQSEGGTIVLVTHSLEQVAELCDRAIVLNRGRLVFDGEPVEAFRVLRSTFAQREPLEGGEGEGELRSVRVEAGEYDAEGVATIRPGDALDVLVTVDSPEALDDWGVGIGIETSAGMTLFGTNSHILKFDPKPLPGRRTVRLRLPEVWLATGTYHLHASFGTLSGGERERLQQAARFNVIGHPRNEGTVHIDSEISETDEA